jgi:HSP20 family molecular chaperone IbpA
MRSRTTWFWIDSLLMGGILMLLMARLASFVPLQWPAASSLTSASSQAVPHSVHADPSPPADALREEESPERPADEDVRFVVSSPPQFSLPPSLLARRGQAGSAFEGSWDDLPAYPAMNMVDAGSDFLLIFCLPGFADRDVRIQINGTTLTLLASRTDDQPECVRRICRAVQLPDVAASGVPPATFWTNGMLHVRIRKAVTADS